MATSESALAPVWNYLGRTSNVVGSTAAVVTIVGTAALTGQSLIAVGLGAIGYGAGYLLTSSRKQQISIGSSDGSVEIATIRHNMTDLQQVLGEHSKDIPVQIRDGVEEIFTILEDILPRWQRLDSFTQDKYTINAIVAEYLPEVITKYLNLPRSYYRNDAKSQAAQQIIDQIAILRGVLLEISDRLHSDIEQDIADQGAFLRDKFNTDSSLKL